MYGSLEIQVYTLACLPLKYPSRVSSYLRDAGKDFINIVKIFVVLF